MLNAANRTNVMKDLKDAISKDSAYYRKLFPEEVINGTREINLLEYIDKHHMGQIELKYLAYFTGKVC